MCAQSIKQTKYETIRDRVNTRENSTLVVATVASSAALVLLTAFDSSQFHCYALVFALLGISYREITIFSIDRRDHNFLRNSSFHPTYSTTESDNKHVLFLDEFARILRSFIFRFLLVLPVNLFVLISYLGCLGLIIVFLIIPAILVILVYLEGRIMSDR